jgi:hypothetical protein
MIFQVPSIAANGYLDVTKLPFLHFLTIFVGYSAKLHGLSMVPSNGGH